LIILKSKNLLARTKLTYKNLIINSQLKSLIIFKRNFILIFRNPKESMFDFSSIKLRNKLTRIKYK